MERKVNEILSKQLEEMRFEKPHRTLILHTEPNPVRRVLMAASGVAAAAIIGTVLLFAPQTGIQSGVVCYVDGRLVSDREAIAGYTREAINTINCNLRKPGEFVLSEIEGNPSMERVGEMLNELTEIE